MRSTAEAQRRTAPRQRAASATRAGTTASGRIAGAPLVGRDRELGHLAQILERASAGAASAVFVLGHPGTGKTRLLDTGVDHAAGRGFRTASVMCLSLSGSLPCDPVLELLRVLGRAHRGSSTATPCELFGPLVETLASVSRERPLLICLDDLHRADPATIELIHCCLARTRDLPIAWLLSSRPGRPQAALAYRLERSADVRRLELDALPAADVDSLARSMLGQAASLSLARVVHARGAGHPQLTVELLRALAAEGLGPGEEQCRRAATLVPAGVGEAVNDWLSQLSPAALSAVEWSAMLPDRFGEAELEAVIGSLSGNALDELADAGLLTRDLAGWSFRQRIVRDAICERFPPAERARRRAARTRATVPGDSTRTAVELEQAGRWREGCDAYMRLAQESAARDSDSAVWLFARAHELAARAGDEVLMTSAGTGRAAALLRCGSVPTSIATTANVTAGDSDPHEPRRSVGPPIDRSSEQLSRRESQVVRLIAAGHTNSEIAAELCVSPKTVERHVSNILAKLGFRSRVQVATAAASGSLGTLLLVLE